MTASKVINPATEEVLDTVEQTDEAGVDHPHRRCGHRGVTRAVPLGRADIHRAIDVGIPVDVDAVGGV
ncbi:hypothetical protein AAV95_16610, partial [Mycolicibacterium elephantis]